jgi:hypothetical protein
VKDPIAQIERAQAVAQSGALELVKSQEVRILNRLVGAHRSAAGLADRDAAIGIAVISELRSIANEMVNAVTQGTDAALKLSEQK